MMQRDRRAKISICWQFFLTGAVCGNWASVLPQAKDEQRLSHMGLGGALVACLLGSMLALPVTLWASRACGSGVSLLIGVAISLFAFPVIGAQNIVVFVLGVFALGFGLGLADVAMNTQAVLCEAATGLPTTGLFHATYAVGSVVGALLGGALLKQGMSVFTETFVFSVVMILPQLSLSWWLYFQQEETMLLCASGESNSPRDIAVAAIPQDDDANENDEEICIELNNIYRVVSQEPEDGNEASANDEETQRHGSKQRDDSEATISPHTLSEEADEIQAKSEITPMSEPVCEGDTSEEDENRARSSDRVTLLLISALCFLGYMGYGSIEDWSAVYLKEDLHGDSLRSALGFVGFSLCVAVGTFASDSLALYLGRRVLLQCAGAVAALGLLIAVVAKSIPNRDIALGSAIAGFSISGIGISVVSPSVISLTGSAFTGVSSSDAITLVSSVGYAGIMAGPPLLGGISAVVGGLRWSLAVDAVLMLLISLLALCL